MNKKIRKKIGDVFEVKTQKGLAYFQYTHEHDRPPYCGSLIRILEGFYQERPGNNCIIDLVARPHRFQTLCFLQLGIRQGEVERVANVEPPDFCKNFPIFKGSNNMPKTDPKEKIWWLWDGEKSWKVGKLSLEEQKKYPLKGTCDITALIQNIETGLSIGRVLC